MRNVAFLSYCVMELRDNEARLAIEPISFGMDMSTNESTFNRE